MMVVRILLVLVSLVVCASSYQLHARLARRRSTNLARGRPAVRLSADEAAEDEPGELALPSGDMELLRARISKIQENGGALATPAQKFFDLAMSKPPQQLMQEFFLTRSPTVVQAMQEAVASLLGALPPFEFDTQMTTTGDKLAALMLQLQMTGYMLRNAEYVVTMRKLLGLKTRSAAEYREAFDRIDLDGSGFIDAGEVEQLLASVYPDGVPSFEISAFVALFDGDGDGKISWEDFSAMLGALDAGDEAMPQELQPLLGEASAAGAPAPEVNGTLVVELDDGGSVEMDAAAYMAQLKEEATRLREELQTAKLTKVEKEAALAASLSAYVSSLPEQQLKRLTNNISEDVVTAYARAHRHTLRLPGGRLARKPTRKRTTLCLLESPDE